MEKVEWKYKFKEKKNNNKKFSTSKEQFSHETF
jgi:hypothetical protein